MHAPDALRPPEAPTPPRPVRPASPPAPPWLRLAPGLFLLLWSSGFAVLKIGLAHAGPMTFLAVRYAMVLGVLLVLAAALRPPLPRRAADWAHLAAVGCLIHGLYFGLTSIALVLGLSAGSVALIVSLQPILVALLAPGVTGERVGARRWIGLALGLLGAALVIVARAVIAVPSPLAVLSAIGALAGMTGGTLYEKRFGAPQHPVTANLVQYAVGLATTLPLAWSLEGLRVEWTGELLLALAYLVVGNSLVSMTLLLAMIRHGEVSRVSALFFLVPPAAALLAWALIGEAMPPLAWFGMGLAAAGVALVTRERGAG